MAASWVDHAISIGATVAVTIVIVAAPVGLVAYALRQLRHLRKGR